MHNAVAIVFVATDEAHVLIPALESLEANPPEHPLQIVVVDHYETLDGWIFFQPEQDFIATRTVRQVRGNVDEWDAIKLGAEQSGGVVAPC